MTVGSVPNTRNLVWKRVGIELGPGNYIPVDRVSRTTAPASTRPGLHGPSAVGVGGSHAGPYRDVSRSRRRCFTDSASHGCVRDVHRPEIAAVGVPQTAIDDGTVPARTIMLPLTTNARAKMSLLRRVRQDLLPSCNGVVIGAWLSRRSHPNWILPIALAVQKPDLGDGPGAHPVRLPVAVRLDSRGSAPPSWRTTISISLSIPASNPGGACSGISRPAQRAEAWQRLGSEQFDVVVIGGGVVGAGSALDAATRGLKRSRSSKRVTSRRARRVAVRRCFTAVCGTSSNSNSVWCVKRCTNAELSLTTLAPHLVKPLPFLFPLTKRVWERPYMAAGIFLYDQLGGAKSVPAQKHLTKSGALRLAPGRRSSLVGGIRYYDTVVDDARPP